MLEGLARTVRARFWRGALGLRARRLRDHEQEIALLPALVDPGALAVDVGANRGLYTWYLRRHARGVHAFEPLPVLARRLRLAYPDVAVHEVALSDREGLVQLRLPGRNHSWATIEPGNDLRLARQPVTAMAIATRPLDRFDLRGVGFIKIDVEGHELAVLRGAGATLVRERPVLLIELEERHSPGAIDHACGLLRGSGYRGYFRDGAALRAVEAFEPGRDQNSGNISQAGRRGRYINNFLFLPERRRPSVLERLVAAGLAIRGD